MIASRFELVIFDCDGVLVESEPIINRAHADMLTACGYPITERDLVQRSYTAVPISDNERPSTRGQAVT
jgi:beta-phosphoglucomutase-like phosphatase (HAD superfamily)